MYKCILCTCKFDLKLADIYAFIFVCAKCILVARIVSTAQGNIQTRHMY